MAEIKIETGDCLLVSSKGILPDAIQWFENCKWNHAAFFLWLNDILYVIESDIHGIALTKFDDYIKGDKGLLICKPKTQLNEQTKSDMINFTLEYTGHTPYDFINLLFFQPIRYITKFLFNKEIWIGRGKSKANRRFICGEWIAYIYNHFFINWFKNWNQISPADIFYDINFNKYEYVRNTKSIKKIYSLFFY